MVTDTGVSCVETMVISELASVGVDVSERSDALGAVAFVSKFIDERGDTPTGWRRKLRSLAVCAIAMRVAMLDGNTAARDSHYKKFQTHWSWLLGRGISEDELKELSKGIRDRMIGE